MEHTKIFFEFYDSEGKYQVETAWALKIGEYYKLDNILFYAPEYSWGDIVEVEDRNEELYVTGLVKESGHSTVRILFNEIEFVQPFRDRLKEMRCESEISNIPYLISVDIPPEVSYGDIKNLLKEEEEKGVIDYQEACIAHEN